MLLNSLFSSPSRFTVSCSFNLFFSSRFFFFKSLFFSATSCRFCFHFLTLSFTSFSSISLKSSMFIGFCLFLSYGFIILWILTQRTVQFFLVLVSFEDDVKITFQIETTFFSGAIDLRKNVSIHVLENVLVTRQIIPQFLVVVLILLQEISEDFQNLWVQDIFTVQVQEIFFLANMLVEFRRHAFFPEHVDHFMLVLISQFSV